MKEIIEGKAAIRAFTAETVSKKMPVFYNPVMKLNRDLSVLLLQALERKGMRLCLPLAATGIRGIRLMLELPGDAIAEIAINDRSEAAVQLIRENLKRNGIAEGEQVTVTECDANELLLASHGFDYIDLDPFGSPNLFLDAATQRIARNGILAVTATDTAPLCGTYPKACLRTYGSKPLRIEQCHEVGLRILVHKVQAVAAHHDKAMTPLLSYAKDHYFRAIFQCTKGKAHADEIMHEQGYLLHCTACLFRKATNDIFNERQCPLCGHEMDYAGPLWLGRLSDEVIAGKMHAIAAASDDKSLAAFMATLATESTVPAIGIYDISELCQRLKLPQIPRKAAVIEAVKRAGFAVADAHLRENSIRSAIGVSELAGIMQRIVNEQPRKSVCH